MLVHVFKLSQSLASIGKVNEVDEHPKHGLLMVGQNPFQTLK
jgi:hypothetical protein